MKIDATTSFTFFSIAGSFKQMTGSIGFKQAKCSLEKQSFEKLTNFAGTGKQEQKDDVRVAAIEIN